MSRCIGRNASLFALMGLLFALAGALLASPANAATVQSGTLTMTSDEGDRVGLGGQYAFDTSAGDVFDSTTSPHTVGVNVQTASGGYWYLAFAAPQGQALAVGTYTDVAPVGTPLWTGPGMSISGNAAGCNTLTGSFTVTQLTFRSGGDVESFAAEFEQHCEGAEPALRGRVHIVTDPPPPPLTIAVGLSKAGVVERASGTATVSGTVTCSAPTMVWVSGTLTQRATRFAGPTGSFSRQVECSGTTAWQATVSSSTSVPFNPGQAELSVNAFAYDANWQQVTDTKAATIRLAR